MKKTVYLTFFLAVVALCLSGCEKKDAEKNKHSATTTIRVGHVGHDHHIALFVALDNASEYYQESRVNLKVVKDRKFYGLFDKNKKIADVEIVKVGGGSKMPTALAQNIIDIGLGGVAAVLAAVDSGAPVKLISPLHNKGDMLVVRPDFKPQSWQEFVAMVKTAKKPLRIGYKNPVAVAKVIFEEALRHEGITFSGNLSQADMLVHMINVKGGGKLNVALSGGLIDGYVGNNPFPAIAVDKGIGRIICDLEELPPGTFRNHPCCCIAANTNAIEEKSEAIIDLLVLFLQANETINSDLKKAVASATRWIGTSESVENRSIPTSGYSMEPSRQWQQAMNKWTEAMTNLDVFRNRLKGSGSEEVISIAYDLSLLEKARTKLAQRQTEK